MLVKLLTNLGSNDYPGMPFKEGEEHEVNEVIGAKLVARKHAVDVTPQPVQEQAVVQEVAASDSETKPTVKPAVSNSKGK